MNRSSPFTQLPLQAQAGLELSASRRFRGRKALAGSAGRDHAQDVSALERLSAEDRLILWPDPIWPQDIGALGVLDG